MKIEVKLVVFAVMFLAIADVQIKSAQSLKTNFCRARGFNELLDIRLLSDPVCFVGNGEDAHVDNADTSDEHIPREDILVPVPETEGTEEGTLGNEIAVDPGILRGVVSEHEVAETTEPQSPGVNIESGDATEQPSPTDQNLHPPSGQDKEAAKPPDDKGAPSRATDDMPSFDEWKRLRLQEEEKVKERSKQQSSGSSSQTNGASTTKAKQNRVNYASASCGAKVVATNSEAQSAGSILSENKDKYVIQPCKAKKWITVELCEPIQVTFIELGNLEFFSSQPESFMIFISDRLSNKDWTSLGTFHARDVRQIQGFPVTDDTYAKYVKLEMLSHYGSEHYCPLTVLRVFGSTVHEEDAEDTHDESYAAEDAKEEEAAEAKDASLLKLAIDTAQSMLQDVMGKKQEAAAAAAAAAAAEEKLGEVRGSNDTNMTKPCPPEVTMDGAVAVNKSKAEPSLFPEAPTPSFSGSGSGIVRLVRTPHTSLQQLLASCSVCEDRPHTSACHMDRHSTCGYYRWLVYAYPSCCTEYFLPPSRPLDLHTTPQLQPMMEEKSKSTLSIHPTPSTVIVESSVQEKSTENVKQKTEAVKPTATKAKDIKPTQKVQEKPQEKPQAKPEAKPQAKPEAKPEEKPDAKPEEKPQSKAEVKASVTSQNGHKKVVDIKPTKTQQQQQATVAEHLEASGQGVEASERAGQAGQAGQATEALEAAVCEEDGCHMGPDVVLIRPPAIDLPIAGTTDTAAMDAAATQADAHTHIYAEAGDVAAVDGAAAMEEQDDEVTVTKKPQLKETTLMKLRNRMKELELNLNLSSGYLEELSQRYRRQMEEMYTSLNRTIEKLSDTSREAAQRDQRQQQDITHLTATVTELNASLTQLLDNMDTLNQQVIERHLLLMVLQFLVFLLFLHWMTSRPAAPVAPPAPATPPSSPPGRVESVGLLARPRGPHRRRRNSSDGTPARRKPSPAVSERRSQDDMALLPEMPLPEIIQPLFLSDYSPKPQQQQPQQQQQQQQQQHKSKKKKKSKHKSGEQQQRRRSVDLCQEDFLPPPPPPLLPPCRRSASQDFGVFSALPAVAVADVGAENEVSGGRCRGGKPKPHMSWDFIHKQAPSKQHYDNGSASSSASSVKSFRKK